jgi:outer membrane protein assembly factor BamB
LKTSNGEKVWEQNTIGIAFSSVVIFSDRLYYGSRDNKLHCLSVSNGNRLWSYETKDDVNDSPVLVDDKVIFASADGNLHCLDVVNGNLMWEKKLISLQYNYIFMKTLEKKIICRIYDKFFSIDSSNGELIWESEYSCVLEQRGFEISNGKIFFLESGREHYTGQSYCLDAKTGNLIWKQTNITDNLSGPIYIDNEKIIYMTDNSIHCQNIETGEMLWGYYPQIGVSVPIVKSFEISNDKLYFGLNNIPSDSDEALPRLIHKIYCISTKDGKDVWTFSGGFSDIVSAPVYSNSKIFIGLNYGDSKLQCINAEDGMKIWDIETGLEIPFSTVSENSNIYFLFK